MSAISTEFLNSPYTTTLFNRSPEQQAETKKVLLDAFLAHNAASLSSVASRNTVLLKHFDEQVETLIKERSTATIEAALPKNAPSIDAVTVAFAARRQVLAELESLHQALPLARCAIVGAAG